MIDPSDREFELEAMASHILRDEETPLVTSDHSSPMQTPTNHTKDIHILSLAFLLIFLAFGAAQNLQSTVNTVSIALLFPLYLYVLFQFCDSFLGFEFMFCRSRTWGHFRLVYCILLSPFSVWLLLLWFVGLAQRMLWFLGLLVMSCM